MPIINTQIKGGVQPTGTKQITSNGVHDVAGYANADVQVPTTAPDYYVGFSKDANNVLIYDSSQTSFNISNVTSIESYVLAYKFWHNSNLTSVDISGLTQLTQANAMICAFSNCSNLASFIDLSNLTTVSGDAAFREAFKDCKKITGADLSSLVTVTGKESLNTAFGNTSSSGVISDSFVSIDLSSLETISAQGSLNAICSNRKSLSSVNISKLKTISASYGLAAGFQNSAITSIDVSKLKEVSGANAMQKTFAGCQNLTSMTFDALDTITGANCMANCFDNCIALTSISFPSLTSSSFGSAVNQFSNLVYKVTGCTIHFPSNLDPAGGSTVLSSLTGYPNFGGTNTVLAFDLPATE